MLRIEQADCYEFLDILKSEGVRIDAVVADPPYCSGGITPASKKGTDAKYLASSNKGSVYYKTNGSFDDSMSSEAFYMFTRGWCLKASQIMKSPGYIFIFTDWRMLGITKIAVEAAGLITRGIAVWDKGTSRPNPGQISQTCEFVVWGTKGFEKSKKYVTQAVIKAPAPPPVKRIHPTEKNPHVIRKLLEVLDEDAEAVLDPFCGSGTAGVAALSRGLSYYACDNQKEYVEKTRARCEALEREKQRKGEENEQRRRETPKD